MKNRRILPTLIYVVVMFAAMSWAMGLFDTPLDDLPYSGVVELFREEQVKSFTVQDDTNLR